MTLGSEFQTREVSSGPLIVNLVGGMIGLPEVTKFQLVSNEVSRPVMWLRSVGEDRWSFPVVEPGPLVANYKLELSDADAELLEIKDGPENAPLVLTVLTMKSSDPQKATINLVAPIVVNRQTLIGKQVIIENYQQYSIEHPLAGGVQPSGSSSC